MLVIYCENNLILTWSVNCFVIDSPVENQVPTTDTKLFIPVVTFATIEIKFQRNNQLESIINLK